MCSKCDHLLDAVTDQTANRAAMETVLEQAAQVRALGKALEPLIGNVLDGEDDHTERDALRQVRQARQAEHNLRERLVIRCGTCGILPVRRLRSPA